MRKDMSMAAAKNKAEDQKKSKPKVVEQAFDVKKGEFVDRKPEKQPVEKWEEFFSKNHHSFMFMYEYITADGKVFTCEARSVKDAQEKRDQWLAQETPSGEE
jgi:hypothetical protein